MAKYRDRRRPVAVEGFVPVIVDNFDAEPSNPNGLVFSNDMATVETHSKSSVEPVPDTVARISKTNMSNPVCFDEKNEVI